MREHEKLKDLGQDELKRIEGIFSDPKQFKALSDKDKAGYMLDYLYIKGKSQPGYTEDKNKRMYFELKSNRSIEDLFTKLAGKTNKGQALLTEAGSGLMVEYGLGVTLNGKKEVGERIGKYKAALDSKSLNGPVGIDAAREYREGLEREKRQKLERQAKAKEERERKVAQMTAERAKQKDTAQKNKPSPAERQPIPKKVKPVVVKKPAVSTIPPKSQLAQENKVDSGYTEFSDPESMIFIANTPEKLMDYEDELNDKAVENDKYKYAVKASAEKAKKMLAALEKAVKKSGNENSTTYKNMHAALKTYAALGDKVDKITPAEVNKAIDDLSKSSFDYDKDHSGLKNVFRSNWGVGKERLDISRDLQGFAADQKKIFADLKFYDPDKLSRGLNAVADEKKKRGLSGYRTSDEGRNNLLTSFDDTRDKLDEAFEQAGQNSKEYEAVDQALDKLAENYITFRKWEVRASSVYSEHLNKPLQILGNNCIIAEKCINEYLAAQQKQGNLGKDMEVSASTDKKTAACINSMKAMKNEVKRVGKYFKARQEENIEAANRRSERSKKYTVMDDRFEDYNNTALHSEGVEKTVSTAAYNAKETLMEPFNVSSFPPEKEFTGDEGKELNKSIAAVVINDYMQTKFGQQLKSAIPEKPEDYDKFLTSVAESEGFKKAMPEKLTKQFTVDFLLDKKMSLVMGDKLMSNLNIQRQNEQNTVRSEKQPQPEMKNTLTK